MSKKPHVFIILDRSSFNEGMWELLDKPGLELAQFRYNHGLIQECKKPEELENLVKKMQSQYEILLVAGHNIGGFPNRKILNEYPNIGIYHQMFMDYPKVDSIYGLPDYSDPKELDWKNQYKKEYFEILKILPKNCGTIEDFIKAYKGRCTDEYSFIQLF